jgi:hypothetical protein
VKKYKVLIFPAGAENSIEIYNSLKYNLHLEVYGLSGRSDHAKFLYPSDKYIEGDYYINNDCFLIDLNRIISDLDIDVVIPTHDTVALYFAKHREVINAKVVVSDYETALIAREKRRTFFEFKDAKYCPTIFNVPEEIDKFPVFLKPNIGEGGKGTLKARTIVEVNSALELNKELVICEYLPGEEITVDCFTNKNGELLFAGPRTRDRVQMGISFNSLAIPLSNEIRQISFDINKKLKFRGPWFFQLKKDCDGNYKLLEVSSRQAGTMALYRQLGVNFALLGIFDVLDYDVSILKNDLSIELDRCLHNRYKIGYDYDNVYIDYDDTLIVDNKVNDTLIKFIYQCINNKKRIFLITKHAYSLKDSMCKYRLSDNMFDEIIHLKEDQSKVDFINPNKSIFIDNYFIERKSVHQLLNIPVFDVDAVDSLIV